MEAPIEGRCSIQLSYGDRLRRHYTKQGGIRQIKTSPHAWHGGLSDVRELFSDTLGRGNEALHEQGVHQRAAAGGAVGAQTGVIKDILDDLPMFRQAEMIHEAAAL